MSTPPLIRPLAAAAFTISGALLLTTCGDDAEALSKEDFVEQADAICEATNDALAPVFDAVWEGLDETSGRSQAEMEQLILVRFDDAMNEVEPLMKQQIEDIRALTPPTEDRELIQDLLDDLETAVADFAATAEAAAAGDEAAMIAMSGPAENPVDDVNRRVREYGLTVCGEEE